jgi:spore maturation protein CgeB
VNCDPLQARWAEEHGVATPHSRYRRDRRGRERLVLAQAEFFAPDVCFVQNLEVLSDRTLAELRSRALLVGQLSTEPPSLRRLQRYDLLVTPLPSLADALSRQGIATAYVPLAFDTRVVERLGEAAVDEALWGAVFIGSLRRFRRWSANRVVGAAAEAAPMDFWGYGQREWPRTSAVRRNYHGTAWGLDMYRVLRNSRVAVNRHGDVAGDEAANMRLFEATGMGTMLVTDRKRNLGDLFDEGAEVVTYGDADELAKLLRYYIGAEDERAAIARAVHARTLRDHSYTRRMAELTEIIESHLGSGSST